MYIAHPRRQLPGREHPVARPSGVLGVEPEHKRHVPAISASSNSTSPTTSPPPVSAHRPARRTASVSVAPPVCVTEAAALTAVDGAAADGPGTACTA